MRTSGLGIVVGTLLGTASAACAWPLVLDGGISGQDRGQAVAIAPNGDPLVTGFVNDAAGRWFVTLRLDAVGNELWQSRYVGGGLGSGYALTVDAAGSLLVAGTTFSNTTFTDYTIAKVDAGTGDTVWRTDLTGPANGGGLTYDQGFTVEADASGDVFGAGLFHVVDPVYESDWGTVRLSGADGTELWRTYATGNGSGTGGGDYPYDLTVDSAGNPIVVGILRNVFNATTSGWDFGVIKYAGSDGSLVWRRDIRGPGSSLPMSSASKVLTLPGDDVAVSGRLSADLPIGDGFYVARLSGNTGATVWSRLLESTGQANGLARDAAGNVIAAGALEFNLAVVKFANGDGTELWRRLVRPVLRPDIFTRGHALEVQVDANGDVVAAGYLDSSFAVIKLAGTDGSPIWTYTITNPATYGYAYDLAVDAAGNVTAVGIVQTLWGAEDFAAVRLDGATGTPIGCGNETLDPGEACDDGNAISGDGCDATCVQSVCGNRIAAGGEQCDDGNWKAGDGCSPACLFEECGNGAVDPGEDCDDGNLVSGDGCEATCLWPTCVGGVAIEQPSVALKHAARGDRYTVKGRLAFAAGMPVGGFDPAANGAQLLIEDLGMGSRAVIDLTRRAAVVPAGETFRCTPYPRWKSSGSTQKWTSKDPQDRLPPVCTDRSGQGLRQLVFKDRRAKGSGVAFTAKGEGFELGPLTGPLRVTLVPSLAPEAGPAGACAVQAFTAGECRRDTNGSLTCRRR